MFHTLLKSKLHRATVTEANLEYEGSCTIDLDLLEKAKIAIYEQVHIVNVNNGKRFVTYVIPGERGSGIICLNGACARLAQINDRIIIMSYGLFSSDEMTLHTPLIFLLDTRNNVLS